MNDVLDYVRVIGHGGCNIVKSASKQHWREIITDYFDKAGSDYEYESVLLS